MHLMFPIYYRAHGVRYGDRLFSPSQVKLTEFPRSALYHFVPGATDGDDPNVKAPYFQGYSKKININYVLEYSSVEGVVQKPSFLIKDALRPFRQANRQWWNTTVDSWKTDQNPETLTVLSYGYLNHIYRYTPNNMAEYYKWRNMFKTVMANAEKIAGECDRQQFIFIKVPTVLQGRTILDKFIDQPPSPRIVSAFGLHGTEGYVQLEIWRFLSVAHRDKSLISLIKPNNYGKINFVFTGVAGGDQIVNLGYLNSWIKGQPNQTDQSTVMSYAVEAVQKLYLKMCMVLNAVNVEDEDKDVPEPSALGGRPLNPVASAKEEPAASDPDDPVSKTDNGYEKIELDTPLSSEEEDDVTFAGVSPAVMSKAKATTLNEVVKTEDEPHRPTSSITSDMFKNLEKDMEALDRLSLVQLKASGVKLSAIDETVSEKPTLSFDEVSDRIFKHVPSTELLRKRIDEDAESNLITAANYRKFGEAVEKYQQSPDPFGSGQLRVKEMVIKPEEIAISSEETDLVAPDCVPDKSMARSSLLEYDRKYIHHVLHKDKLAAIDAVQSVGVAITRHEVEVNHSALGSYERHVLELKPVDGAPSTLNFTFPTVDADGTFIAGGNKYLMRKQRVDMPIRKISPRIVALSTYYGKTFVQLNTKVVNDDLAWLFRQINLLSLDGSGIISDMSMGNVFDNDFEAPMIYNAMASEFENFVVKNKKVGFITLNFENKNRLSYDPVKLKAIEKNGRVYCGHLNVKHHTYIVVDKANNFTLIDGTTETPLGSITDVIGISTEKRPVNFAEVRIFSKYVPVAIVLAYYVGFEGLLTLLRVPYRVVEGRKQKNLEADEVAITFKDQSVVFKNNNAVTSMVLAGFNDFEKSIKLYDRALFDTKDVYLNILMTKKMGAIYLRELDMLENGFVDPITREILADMREPQTYMGLIVRSCELLTTFHHPSTQDRTVMRERGYERFAGVMYKELMQAIRQFRNKNLVGRSKIDMSPYQVWNAIMKDNSLKIVEDINPIQNLKESEVITYAGTGGRDKDTMTKESRAYHKSDIGVLSEATVDSSGVGTIAYLSANPNIKNVRGVAAEEKELSPTNILSTSALVSPASTNDNGKRIMFISTQHSHTIASDGYRQPYIRTGYEFMVGKRTGKMFSTAANEDGKVTAVTEKGLIVTYKSGEVVGIELGRVYGKAEGTVYPHDVVSSLKVGDSFKKGDILAYNKKFFEPDFIDPKNIILKTSGVSTVAFNEGNGTHEDSSTISEKFGSSFKTEVAKIKSYVVDFKQNILEPCKSGDPVGPKDILMIIEDEITSQHGQFSQDSLSALKRLSNIAPKAGVMGTVEKIEVFYNGDKHDMTESLKRLVNKSDNDMAAAAKSSARPVINGRVTEEYRVNGTPLEMDKAEIRFYISIRAGTGVGDKVIFGHQMKSTVAEVHESEIHAENGDVVDAVFSYRSVAARDVLSPSIMGTTITILDAIGKQAAKLYFGGSA